MVQKALNYQIMVKRIITVPFLTLLVICIVVFSLYNLNFLVHNEIKHAKTTNQLLAKVAATGNSALITQLVTDILKQSPQVESLMFFSFNEQQNPITKPIKLKNILFDRYYGLSEPVKITLSNTSTSPTDPQINQLIGYINLTLDLQKIRKQWVNQNFALFIIIFLLTLANLVLVLSKMQKLGNRLLSLEALSNHVLNDEFIEAEKYELPKNNHEGWIFEKALMYLLNKRKAQYFQIQTMEKEQLALKQSQLQQIEQSSKFENILIHEFKVSVNRIQSGLQLLENQYISAEQKDAIEIISVAKDDLNAKLDQIIQINRINKGQSGVGSYQFSPSLLVSQIIADYQTLANQKNLNLTAKIFHSDYILEGDVQKITLVISSLLENAIKFTEKGSVTLISQLQHLQSTVRWIIEIQDTGPSIANKYQQQIFEPFFQINPEIKHTISTKTVGLYLVKKLVTLMNGDIQVTSEPNIGTTFHVSLTLNDWKNYYERTLLTHKHIVIWYRFEDLIERSQRFINAGARVELFTNQELLADYLLTHDVDLLIISRYIDIERLFEFMYKFRELEVKQRVISIYFYDAKRVSPHNLELLKMAGVDYLVSLSNLEDSGDDYLKQIAKLLA